MKKVMLIFLVLFSCYYEDTREHLVKYKIFSDSDLSNVTISTPSKNVNIFNQNMAVEDIEVEFKCNDGFVSNIYVLNNGVRSGYIVYIYVDNILEQTKIRHLENGESFYLENVF